MAVSFSAIVDSSVMSYPAITFIQTISDNSSISIQFLLHGFNGDAGNFTSIGVLSGNNQVFAYALPYDDGSVRISASDIQGGKCTFTFNAYDSSYRLQQIFDVVSVESFNASSGSVSACGFTTDMNNSLHSHISSIPAQVISSINSATSLLSAKCDSILSAVSSL